MKKQIFALGLMLAATFTLTNCAKEMDSIAPENEGVAFEIVASAPQVKTVNNGMKTTWKAADAINLFHAVTDGTTYVNDNSFTISADNLAAGKFTGTLSETLDPQEEYDWYAFYPYSSYIKTPAAQTNGYTYIGGRSDTPQSQSGADNMSHIAGSNYPLFGKAVAVSAGSTPNLVMSHASALIEVKVKNSTEAALDVTTVSFTAPESIVGTFYPNFAGEDIAYTDATYVSDVANLTVSDASIEAGATASFYLAVKPFVASTGDKLIISVNGYSKELTMTADVKFSAGKIKTLNFSYDKEETSAPGLEDADKIVVDFSTKGYANGVSVPSFTQMPVTITFAKGSNSNDPKYYTTGTAIRAYGGNTITVSSALGKVVGVEFIFSTTETSSDNSNGITANAGSLVLPTWTGSEESVTFTISGTTGHRRIQKLEVYVDTEGETWEAIKLGSPVVQCSAQTESALTFQWAAIENALGYEVAFDGKAETVTETVYNVMDLDPETEYEISVKALGDGTYYLDSEVVKATGETTAEIGSSGVPTDATLSFANKAQRTTFTTSQQVWQQNGITLTNDKGSSTSNVADYAGPARFYASSKITVTAPGLISKIVFDANSSSYATAMKNSIGTVTGATVAVSSDKVTVTYTTPVESVVIAKLTAQVRMDSITVTYLK